MVSSSMKRKVIVLEITLTFLFYQTFHLDLHGRSFPIAQSPWEVYYKSPRPNVFLKQNSIKYICFPIGCQQTLSSPPSPPFSQTSLSFPTPLQSEFSSFSISPPGLLPHLSHGQYCWEEFIRHLTNSNQTK